MGVSSHSHGVASTLVSENDATPLIDTLMSGVACTIMVYRFAAAAAFSAVGLLLPLFGEDV